LLFFLSHGLLVQKKSTAISPSMSFTPLYSDVVIPPCDEPLPKEMLIPEKVVSWTVQEVCRWLKMKKLNDLLLPFVWHNIDGHSLLALHAHRAEGVVEVLRHMGATRVGISLNFYMFLNELLAAPPGPTYQEMLVIGGVAALLWACL